MIASEIMSKFCGFEYKHLVDLEVILMSSEGHIAKLLEEQDMTDCTPPLSPYLSGVTVEDLITSDPEERDRNYPVVASIVGSARYIMQCHQEITGPVLFYACAMHSPSDKCVVGCKKLVRYLKGTQRQPLCIAHITGKTIDDLEVINDASHANMPGKRSAGCTIIRLAGNCIDVSASTHKLVTRAATGSELVRLDVSAHKAKFYEALLTDLGYPPVLPVPFLEDCSATFQLSNPSYQMKPDKWIDIRFQYFKQLVEENFATLVKVKAEDMYANMGTKLAVSLLEFLRTRDYLQNTWVVRLLGLCPVEDFVKFFDDNGFSKWVVATHRAILKKEQMKK